MDFNPEFITRLLHRLDWPTVYAGAEKVRHDNSYSVDVNI